METVRVNGGQGIRQIDETVGLGDELVQHGLPGVQVGPAVDRGGLDQAMEGADVGELLEHMDLELGREGFNSKGGLDRLATDIAENNSAYSHGLVSWEKDKVILNQTERWKRPQR